VSWQRYDVTPVPAPRQTGRDAWNPSPGVQRYRAFRDEIALRGVSLPAHAHVVFVLPMPPSWSMRKRERFHGTSHTSKPDVDNCLKALLDAIYRGQDDAHVWDVRASKVWGDAGAIYVRELEPPELPA
jgi:Holliday junction resolvase RusA-like endonuclease